MTEAEQAFIDSMEKFLGRKLSEQEKHLAIVQAELMGDL